MGPVGETAVIRGFRPEGLENGPRHGRLCGPKGCIVAVPRSLPCQTVRGHTLEDSGTDVAVKLRLMRMGKKKQPTYRVVAADSRKARNGRIIEAVGFYDPRRDPSVIEIDNEKAVEWLRNGAQPTERVEKLLKITGAWDEFKGQPVGTSVTAAPVAPAVPAPVDEVVEEAAEEAPAEESEEDAS